MATQIIMDYNGEARAMPQSRANCGDEDGGHSSKCCRLTRNSLCEAGRPTDCRQHVE